MGDAALLYYPNKVITDFDCYLIHCCS